MVPEARPLTIGTYAEICLRPRAVAILQILASSTEDRKAPLERRIEASCADNRVDRSMFAISSHDACRVDVVDSLIHDMHVIRCHCLEVARTGCETLAQWREIRQ